MAGEEKFNFTFPDDEAGKAFARAIVKIIERKQGRNSLYKDNWYDRNRITYHTDRIDSKAGRIKQAEDNFFAEKITLPELLAVLEEEAGDIAVYALFIMAKVNKLYGLIIAKGKRKDFTTKDFSLYLSEQIRKEETDGES